MVLRLAVALDVPLRDRNGLLVAAGFAPIYPEHGIDHPAVERVMAALGARARQHAPYPAVVMDRRWDVVRVNSGAARLFADLCAPEPVPDPANVLRLMLEPGPVRAAVENWDEVAPSLLERARREAVGGVMDLATAELVQRLRTGADAAVFAAAPRSITPTRAQSSTWSSPHGGTTCAGSRSSRRSARPSTSPLRSCAWKRSSRPTTRQQPVGTSSAPPPDESQRLLTLQTAGGMRRVRLGPAQGGELRGQLRDEGVDVLRLGTVAGCAVPGARSCGCHAHLHTLRHRSAMY